MIKKLQLYFVKFNNNGTMKNKEYLLNCMIKSTNQRLIIIIIYNKSIFSTNNSI